MKGLRIILGILLMLGIGHSLPAFAVAPKEKPRAVAPKTPQGDTLRMTWTANDYNRFYFWGEKDATYKVEWGDGTTSTVTGKGYGRYDDYYGGHEGDRVDCYHKYSQPGEYKVKLYGVAAAQKKKK